MRPDAGTTRADPVDPALGRTASVRVADALFQLLAVLFFGILLFYYATGAGGPMLLAVTMVPMAVAVVNFNDARQSLLYPPLRHGVQLALAFVSLGLCLAAAFHLVRDLENIRVFRAGLWSRTDLLAGGIIVALILEFSWRKYRALFVLNVALLIYAVYGPYAPGALQHPGISWTRALSSVSVEMSTGVFDRLAQLALTLIGAFILVLAVLRAFGCIDAILRTSGRLAVRSPQLLPQAAVVGSFAIAAVSGSGAANAATTGSVTIPALIRAGFSRVQAAAVETAASLGGQLMPPLMGIAAFMMAELMGVSYFEVVARGFAPALIYFGGVSLAVYLLTQRIRGGIVVPSVEPLTWSDLARLLAWILTVGGLIWLMGVERQPAMTGARNVFLVLFTMLLLLHIVESVRGVRDWRIAVRPLRDMVETFAITTAELTVLLSTLGILTAIFTVTGVPTKVGVLILEMAEVHVILMVLVSFLFGYLVGMGLPAAPTYIILAVVIAPFMVNVGIDPWVVHFFAFFIAVLGELSPPTSVTAAVASRIADASFGRTMWVAMGLCVPLILLMAAVFTRPALVLAPGMAQVGAALLTGIGVTGFIFALQSILLPHRGMDVVTRGVLGLLGLAAILHPTDSVAWGFAAATLAVLLAVPVWTRLQRLQAS